MESLDVTIRQIAREIAQEEILKHFRAEHKPKISTQPDLPFPGRVGCQWSEEDRTFLLTDLLITIHRCCNALGRTPGGVISYITKSGLLYEVRDRIESNRRG